MLLSIFAEKKYTTSVLRGRRRPDWLPSRPGPEVKKGHNKKKKKAFYREGWILYFLSHAYTFTSAT